MNDKLETQCKNCKYYKDRNGWEGYENDKHYYYTEYRPSVKENDFCGKFKINREKK